MATDKTVQGTITKFMSRKHLPTPCSWDRWGPELDPRIIKSALTYTGKSSRPRCCCVGWGLAEHSTLQPQTLLLSFGINIIVESKEPQPWTRTPWC